MEDGRRDAQRPGTTGRASDDARVGRNPGMPLDLGWIASVGHDAQAIHREAEATPLPTLRVTELVRAVRLMDLTTLDGSDTAARVGALCDAARAPLPPALIAALGPEGEALHVAAVCVFPRFVPAAREALLGSNVRVATVGAGFPHGLSPVASRISEIELSVQAGAQEVDPVITRALAIEGDWSTLYAEVRAFRDACGPATMKVILATGELPGLDTIARAALVCMMAGADFVKTSTGKEKVNATLPAGLVMLRAIRLYRERTGHAVGFKAAGGIREAGEALRWMRLAAEELGEPWLRPERFRFGASALLGSIEVCLNDLVPTAPT